MSEWAPQTQIRCGFKSRKQLPLFMVWREFYAGDDSEPYFAEVLFNSMRWFGR